MHTPRAIIFDADGTLFDTFELIVSAYHHVADVHGLVRPTPEQVRDQLGKSLPDIFRHFYPDANIEELLHTNNTYFAANAMKSAAFDGVADLLVELKAQGYMLGILTSGGSKIIDSLQQHSLHPYFSSIVHHERIQNAKPDPEGFLLACLECDVLPHEAIMIGDTTYDIDTGKNAGAFATIAVTHGSGTLESLQQSNPTYIADGMSGVRDILASIRNSV